MDTEKKLLGMIADAKYTIYNTNEMMRLLSDGFINCADWKNPAGNAEEALERLNHMKMHYESCIEFLTGMLEQTADELDHATLLTKGGAAQ